MQILAIAAPGFMSIDILDYYPVAIYSDSECMICFNELLKSNLWDLILR